MYIKTRVANVSVKIDLRSVLVELSACTQKAAAVAFCNDFFFKNFLRDNRQIQKSFKSAGRISINQSIYLHSNQNLHNKARTSRTTRPH